jgi:hypothetical protein
MDICICIVFLKNLSLYFTSLSLYFTNLGLLTRWTIARNATYTGQTLALRSTHHYPTDHYSESVNLACVHGGVGVGHVVVSTGLVRKIGDRTGAAAVGAASVKIGKRAQENNDRDNSLEKDDGRDARSGTMTVEIVYWQGMQPTKKG